MNVRLTLFGVLIAVASFAGCGSPGAPLPPSLELPRAATDLTATRKGDKVFLSWTAPNETTDGQRIRARKLGPAQICRQTGTASMGMCVQQVGQIPATQIPLANPGEKPKRIDFTDTLPTQLETEHPTGFATYAVAHLNWRGKTYGFSNQVRVPLAPVIVPPQDVRADVTAEAIVLNWRGTPHEHPSPDLRHIYRVYRREGRNIAAIGEIQLHTDPQAVFYDRSFEWQKTYYYHVTPVTLVTQNGKQLTEIEGDDSPEIKVFANDVFPPARPTGLQAVFSGVGQKPFIDLTWAPNTESDLAGYNIYRHEQGQPAARINSELVATPSYRDANVQPGRTYYYAISAVDLRGNESAKSQETSERVP